MALNIKDAATDRAARELADLTGEPITTATRIAIEERLVRVRAQTLRADPDALHAIILRGRARATLDRRTDDEILGYDADGLPG